MTLDPLELSGSGEQAPCMVEEGEEEEMAGGAAQAGRRILEEEVVLHTPSPLQL